jgi:hypothetical protein
MTKRHLVPQESSSTTDNNSGCPEIHPVENSPLGWGYLPTVEEFIPLPGTSHTPDIVVQTNTWNGFGQPQYNLERRQRELHEIGLM